ncbi:flippase [Stenotrophomonas sp. TWI602]|uniref:flippase n=1 Tax=Stenotrophomonas sp. TWI602 TaxID=3136786 RepID=UPI00320965AA
MDRVHNARPANRRITVNTMKYARTLSHIVLLWGGSLAGAGIAFLTQVALGRHLGPDDYGTFSSALAQTILLSQVAGIGLQTFWLSAYGREGWLAARWLPSSIKLLGITSTVSIAIYLAMVAVAPNKPHSIATLLWMAPSILGFAAVELTASKLQLEERFLAISIWQVAHHALRFGLVLALIQIYHQGGMLLGTSAIYSLVAMVLATITYRQLKSMSRGDFNLCGHGERPSRDRAAPAPSVKDVFRESWPFGADALLYLAYFQCSNILLIYLAGDRAAGLYFSAFNIMNAIYLLPTVLYTKFLLSKIHRWAHHERAKLKTLLHAGATAMLCLGVTCTLVVWLASDFIIQSLYGKQFSGAEPILLTLAFCAPLRFVSTSIGAILTTGSQMMTRIKIKVICAVLCIALNLILIPKLGAMGAALSTVATELCLLVLFSIITFIRRQQIFG